MSGLPRDPVQAARHLLGMELRSTIGDNPTAVVITETEAYDGASDPASHAFRGPTPRNTSMFGPPGTLYVYRSYGIHWCMNVVCGTEGSAGAVLLRAGAPIEGMDEMLRRRGRKDHLCDGPGKLCQALGVTGDHDGTSLFTGPVLLGERLRTGEITATPRIGISVAKDRPWRFVLRSVR